MTGFAWILILNIISLTIPITLTSSLVNSEATQKALFRALKTSQCNIQCKDVKRRPVCGSDGKTYESRCDLKRAKRCERRDVDIASKGSCSQNGRGSSSSRSPRLKCVEEQAKARTLEKLETKSKSKSGAFIPDCNGDGTFAKVQCHRQTGYCWCSTKHGRHIPGTSVSGQRPKCRDKNRKRNRKHSGKKSRKRGCGPQDRANFNRNLISVFTEEYSRIKQSLSVAKVANDPLMDKEEKRVVEWKFTELDKDKDNFLKYKEVRSLRRMIKKLIKPKTCAKTFIKYCDRDRNKEISRDEWSLCLGVDISNEKPTPTAAVPESLPGNIPDFFTKTDRWQPPKKTNLGPSSSLKERHYTKTTSAPTRRKNPGQHKNCNEERAANLKRQRDHPEGDNFIPSCSPGGVWEKAQCHRQTTKLVCWCTDQLTGKPIPRTATLNREPECDIEPERQMKGCPHNKKRTFLLDLMAQLKIEMRSRTPNNSFTTFETRTEYSDEETVSRWKFMVLDGNRNQILERKELKAMKREIKTNSSTRKCRRRFVRYCDADGDKIVTMDEWIECMGINHNYYHTLPQNPKRRGRNPFIDQLT